MSKHINLISYPLPEGIAFLPFSSPSNLPNYTYIASFFIHGIKMKNLVFALIILVGISFISCSTPNAHQIEDKDLLELVSRMTGSFNSSEQEASDSAYFNINLEMVRIWPERTDAVWLYIEQATSWSLDKPYRQRVYKVTRLDDTYFQSEVYSFDEPLRFAGVWKEKEPLAGLTPDSLSVRQGCAIILIKKDGNFVGSTIEKNCVSNLRGASYATSEVSIEKDVLRSWDRGFNDKDEHVWGAEKGPYIFKKYKDYEPKTK